MKAFLIAVFIASLSATAGSGTPVRGDAYTNVLAVLGEPQGVIEGGDYRLLYYERGKIELVSNVVVKVDLISADEAATRRLLREKQAAEAAVAAERARADRIADGTRVRQAKLADASFAAQAAPERLAFWQRFKQLYPEVPLGDEYALALQETEREYAKQREERERTRDLERLERRVADAERRADLAEDRARVSYTFYQPPLIYGCYRPASAYVSPLLCPPGSFHEGIGMARYDRDFRAGLAPGFGSTVTYGPGWGVNVTIGGGPRR